VPVASLTSDQTPQFRPRHCITTGGCVFHRGPRPGEEGVRGLEYSPQRRCPVNIENSRGLIHRLMSEGSSGKTRYCTTPDAQGEPGSGFGT